MTRRDVERLAALRSDDGVVSAYIGIEPLHRYDPTHHEAQFKSAVKRFMRRNQNRDRQQALEREKDRILDFLRGWTPDGRGLVVFTCTPAGIWETVQLEMLVPSFVDVDPTPNTAVLMQVLDEYPRFVVAVVQRDKAAVYIGQQRRADEEAAITSDVPGQHDQGGWAQARFQRHIEVHVERHMNKLVDELKQLYYERPFGRLAVGGTEENTKELIGMLPDPVRRRVIGAFPVDFKHDTEDDVLTRAREVHREFERRSEQELVARVADAAEAGGQAALGIEPTLRAIREGRVQTLLIAEGATADGSACLECDYFSSERFDHCPVCNGEADQAPDIVERAVERALFSGSQVEFVFGEAREWLLARGGLAAALRY